MYRQIKNTLNMETFFSWYESRLKNYSIEIKHSKYNDIHLSAVKHDLGINWSKYHKTLLEPFLGNI
ncbi:MAG: hypothetical protein ACPKPY_07760 [Nitrososphaeraceae archaeon]